ncbi:MAG: ferrochelatase [bacterium]
MSRPSDHPPIAPQKTGILLVNLGTPEQATGKSVRRYLQEFLSDRRVADYPRAIWLPLLHGIILNFRPAKAAKSYAKIWRDDSNESPLRYFTRQQSDLLAEDLSSNNVMVDWAMRYGAPAIQDRLAYLQRSGCTQIFILPLYPQYSATTTGSVIDEVARYLLKARWQPAIRTAPAFHDHPAYIAALAGSINRADMAQAERIIVSFHGLPERYLTLGDPYYCQCQKTGRLLREQMGWSEEFAPIGFQSKFGREKWLEPSTQQLAQKAAADGVKHLAVIAPAFISDCIETLEELGIELARDFRAAGGQTLQVIPCLNDSPEAIDLLAELTRTQCQGWL